MLNCYFPLKLDALAHSATSRRGYIINCIFYLWPSSVKRASGVPCNFRELLLAGLPLGAREQTRRDVNQARNEFEYSGSVPGVPVTGAIFADVQGVGHAAEGDILDDHFCKKFEGLRFKGIVFQMATVGRDAEAEGDLFGANFGRWLFGPTGDFNLALPLEGDKAPACVMHLGQINGSGEDRNLLSNAVDFFHRSAS